VTHAVLRIEDRLVFDGNIRLLDKQELQGLIYNTVAKAANSRIRVEIVLKEEPNPEEE
jgi:cytochrome c-type biogenesis protein CcmH/NrfG